MKSKRIYLASSWKNTDQPLMLQCLRDAGHRVYDFRNPWDLGYTGFSWHKAGYDPNDPTTNTDIDTYLKALDTDAAQHGFQTDMDAMVWADTCVLLLESGRSAHLEAGWFVGNGVPTIVFMSELHQPELMYKMCDAIVTNIDDLIKYLEDH